MTVPERPAAVPADGDLLTVEERALVRDLGRWYTRLAAVTGDSPRTREDDLREAEFHVHALQRAVMAQAAARAYPAEFRLLGEVIPGRHDNHFQGTLKRLAYSRARKIFGR
jgi:hypothetical protein